MHAWSGIEWGWLDGVVNIVSVLEVQVAPWMPLFVCKLWEWRNACIGLLPLCVCS